MLSGSYNVPLAGPGFANAIGTTLTVDITSLILRPIRLRAARSAGMQVDANVIWQEWQTVSRAQTLAIDLVEQGRLLRLTGETLALLRRRGDTASMALAQGNTTLQVVAPFATALATLLGAGLPPVRIEMSPGASLL